MLIYKLIRIFYIEILEKHLEASAKKIIKLKVGDVLKIIKCFHVDDNIVKIFNLEY